MRQALHSITSKRPGDDIIARHTYGYDTLGRINSWQREATLANPTGTTREDTWTLKHDFNSQLTDVLESAAPTSSVQSAWHFNYDTAANLRSIQHTPASNQAVSVNTRTHNNLNQITGLTGGGSTLVRGTLDEPGNVAVGITGHSDRPAKMLNETTFEAELDLPPGTTSNISVTAQDGSGNRSHYTYDVEVASETARSFIYDDDGNLTSDGVRTYAWDSQSRLTMVTWADRKTTEFTYNALGQRSERTDTDDGTVSHHYYLYDGISLVDRRTGTTPNTATIDRRYFAEGEQRLTTSSIWENYHYCLDLLGSIREVVKWDGTLVARYDYDPYGRRQTQYQSSTYAGGSDLGFTGHITIPSIEPGQTEILLAHYRGYDPELARWLSADPLSERGGLNLYGYVENNPANQVDPLGLEAKIHVYRTSLTSCASVLVYENGKYLGAFIANSNGFMDNPHPPSDGTYRVTPKRNYQNGDSFVSGTPTITGLDRIHPDGLSKGCLTVQRAWANRLWDIMDRNLKKGGTDITYKTEPYPRAFRADNPYLSAPTCHSWPIFNIQGREPVPVWPTGTGPGTRGHTHN